LVSWCSLGLASTPTVADAKLPPLPAAGSALEFAGVQLDAGLVEGRLHLAAYALGLGASGMTFVDSELAGLIASRWRPALHLRRGADLPQQERRPSRRASSVVPRPGLTPRG
jgi:hypothetical protein